MNLEKANDKLVRGAWWDFQKLYSIGDGVVKVIKSSEYEEILESARALE